MSIEGQTPNILLIIADDLGQDVVNISGTGKDRAMQVHTNDGTDGIDGDLPNISLFLRNGLYFEQAWAQPACSPTRASIFTGWHPWRNGVGNPQGAQLDPAKGFTALPNVLKDKGYVSGLFGKWHLGEVAGFLPSDHGWDKHVGTLVGVLPEVAKDPYKGYGDWDMVDSDESFVIHMTEYATLVTVKEAAKWINAQDSATPWFATIAFHSPHLPFHIPPGGFDAATAGDTGSKPYMFNVMAQNMDYNIGKLLGTSSGGPSFTGIKEDQLSNTIIVFIGDNGSDVAVALEEAKNYIYEGSVRVPMIFADGQAVMNEIKEQAITPRFLHADGLNATRPHMIHVVDLYDTIKGLLNVGSTGTRDSYDYSYLVESGRYYASNVPLGRDYNFSQYYKGSTKLATIRNSGYKLNYDASAKPEWSLYKYSGGEIPGIEIAEPPAIDDAENLYEYAMTHSNLALDVELNNLLDELLANYQIDETNTFPDPR